MFLSSNQILSYHIRLSDSEYYGMRSHSPPPHNQKYNINNKYINQMINIHNAPPHHCTSICHWFKILSVRLQTEFDTEFDNAKSPCHHLSLNLNLDPPPGGSGLWTFPVLRSLSLSWIFYFLYSLSLSLSLSRFRLNKQSDIPIPIPSSSSSSMLLFSLLLPLLVLQPHPQELLLLLVQKITPEMLLDIPMGCHCDGTQCSAIIKSVPSQRKDDSWKVGKSVIS